MLHSIFLSAFMDLELAVGRHLRKNQRVASILMPKPTPSRGSTNDNPLRFVWA
jgi:hypothetical protein